MTREPVRVRVLSVVLLAVLAPAGVGRAAELPSDLDLVPRDAAAFVHIRAADIYQTEMMADFRHLIDRAGPEAWNTFEKKCPLPPAAFERLTVILSTPKVLAEPFPDGGPEAVSALFVVRTKRPYPRIQLMQMLGQREKVYRRQVYHFNEELWSGLYLVDDRTFLIGSEDALIQYLDMRAEPKKQGPLQPALEEAAGTHHVVLGVNPSALQKENLDQMLPAPLKALLGPKCGVFTANLDKGLKLHMRLEYEKEADAQQGEKVVRAALELARTGLSSPIQELENQLNKDPKKARPELSDLPESFGALLGLGFLREVDAQLKEAAVSQKGATVQLPVHLKRVDAMSSTMTVSWLAAFMIGRSAMARFDMAADEIRAGGKDPNEEHLNQLVHAMDHYRQEKGSYPPPATYDKEGRPLLSWRVALLPYLGEEALYREFRLDEPWDSLHNKKLIKKLPKCLGARQGWRYRGLVGRTNDLVFTGADTAFPGKKGASKEDVAKKILVVQSSISVYWTKPHDIPYRADKPLPELFERYGGNIRVMLGDGTYKTLDRNTEEKVLRELIQGKK
jgi:hypothetical protein